MRIGAWRLIFDSQIIEMILICTIIFLEKVSSNFKRERDMKLLAKREFCAFVELLLYVASLHKFSLIIVKDLWATDCTILDIFP